MRLLGSINSVTKIIKLIHSFELNAPRLDQLGLCPELGHHLGELQPLDLARTAGNLDPIGVGKDFLDTSIVVLHANEDVFIGVCGLERVVFVQCAAVGLLLLVGIALNLRPGIVTWPTLI